MGGGPKRAADAPPLGNIMAIATVVKCMIGAGILGLPKAFGKVGLGLAVPGSLAIGILSACAAYLLCKSKLLTLGTGKEEDSSLSNESDDSFTEDLDGDTVMEIKDYGLGPVAAVGNKLFGMCGVVMAAIAVWGTQAGLCIAYVKVIMVTLLGMPSVTNHIPDMVVYAVVCIILCLLSLIRKLSSLACLSIVALAAYAFVMLDLVINGWNHIASAENMTFAKSLELRPSGIMEWFGTSVFAFEGIVMAQYVCDDMKLGKNLKPFKTVLAWSYGTSWALFAGVASYGFLAYGETVGHPFYESFPKANVDTKLDEVILVFVLLLSFALQEYPMLAFLDYLLVNQKHAGQDIVSDSSAGDGSDDFALPRHTGGKKILDVAIRVGLTLVFFIVGVVMPKVNCVCDLVGAVFMSPMAFILPGLFHWGATRGKASFMEIVLDVTLITIGIASMILGFVSAPTCFSAAE